MKKLLSLLVLLSLAVASHAVVKTLGWTAPATYTNGDPLPTSEIKQYNIYWGTVNGGPYPNMVSTTGAEVALDVDLAEGNRIYVVCTCVATNDLESDFSAQLAINLRKPGKPLTLKLQ